MVDSTTIEYIYKIVGGELEAERSGGSLSSQAPVLNTNLLQGANTVKGFDPTGITVTNEDELGAVQEINLLADPLFNVKYGFETLDAATTLDQSVAIGHQALKSADGFGESVVVGHRCCRDATEVEQVVAIGHDVLLLADKPTDIVAIGDNVLDSATTGTINKSTAIGHNVLTALTSGQSNTAIGASAGIQLATGNTNILIGPAAGGDYTTSESNNICIGSNTGTILDNQTIRIGSAQTNTFIKGIHNVTPGGATETVVVDSAGELGSITTPVGTVTASANLTDVALVQGDGGVKGVKSTTITVANNDELNNVQEVNLLVDGSNNTWYGFGTKPVIGSRSTRLGDSAAGSMTTFGSDITAIGYNALGAMTTSNNNEIAIGSRAHQDQKVNNSDPNLVIGSFGLGGDFAHEANVLLGHAIATTPTSIVRNNVVVGGGACGSVDTIANCVIIGNECLTTGTFNNTVSIGNNTLVNTNGTYTDCIIVGADCIPFNPDGGTMTGTIIIGKGSGTNYQATESNNIIIGTSVGGTSTENQVIRIGNAQTSCHVKGIHGVTPSGVTENAIVNSGGQLGSTPSLVGDQLDVTFTATEDDSHAVAIDCDAAGFADVKALDVIYKSGALNAGDANTAQLSTIDESLSTGGRLFGNVVVSTNIGSAETHALGVGSTVHPIYHKSGGYANADSILVNAVDEKTDLSSGGAGNVSVFVADNDTMTVGSSAKYSEMQIQVDTPSSGGGVAPIYEYSTGVGTWASFSPIDGTNGFRNSGTILWDNNDIAGWLVGLASEFLIRITRTRNTLSTTPILDLVQISATSFYQWDLNGDVTVNSVNVKECNLIETGGGTDIITIQAPAAISNYTLTLPVDDGNADEVLTTNGSGVLTWGAGGLPAGYLSGFEQVNATTTTITFGTASETSTCRDVDDTFDITWSGLITLTITNTDVAGGYSDAGGNPVSANQPLQIYAIADSTGVNTPNVLCSAVGQDITGLSLFTGGSYDKLRRIGWARTLDGAATLIPHMVGGKGRSRNFHYTGGRANQTVLFAGSATTWTDMTDGGNGTDTYTAPGSHHMICRTAFGSSASANDEVVFRQNGSTLAATDAEYTFSSGSSLAAGELADGQLLIHLGGDRITEYEVSAAANDAYCYVISCSFGI